MLIRERKFSPAYLQGLHNIVKTMNKTNGISAKAGRVEMEISKTTERAIMKQ